MKNSGTASTAETETVKTKTNKTGSFKTGLQKFDHTMDMIGLWLYRLRKFVLAAPVVYYALRLAAYNSKHLPELVGLGLQADGEFAFTISRYLAVVGPLGLTAGCLVMMFCARKAMYSWAISIFTLALPLLLLLSNTYPA